jgi:hypothetical protein
MDASLLPIFNYTDIQKRYATTAHQERLGWRIMHRGPGSAIEQQQGLGGISEKAVDIDEKGWF